MSESATLDAPTAKDVRDEVYAQPIETLNVAKSALFQSDVRDGNGFKAHAADRR